MSVACGLRDERGHGIVRACGRAVRRPLGGQVRRPAAGRAAHAQTAALVATDTSLWWFDGYCRIGKMYKAKAVYVQAHCGVEGDVPVTLDADGRPHAGDLGRARPRICSGASKCRALPGSAPLSVTAAPTASVMGHRAFALFWGGRIVSILSFQMLMVAIGWQLYSLTGSALDLGLLRARAIRADAGADPVGRPRRRPLRPSRHPDGVPGRGGALPPRCSCSAP